MTKYFSIEMVKNNSGSNGGDKTLRTWNETMVFLQNIFNDLDMIIIRYVGDR